LGQNNGTFMLFSIFVAFLIQIDYFWSVHTKFHCDAVDSHDFYLINSFFDQKYLKLIKIHKFN
jgi:hypothetical protein